MKAIIREHPLDRYSEEEVVTIVKNAMEDTTLTSHLGTKVILYTKLRDKFNFTNEQLQKLEDMSYDENLNEELHDLRNMDTKSTSSAEFLVNYLKTEFNVDCNTIDEQEE